MNPKYMNRTSIILELGAAKRKIERLQNLIVWLVEYEVSEPPEWIKDKIDEALKDE